MFTRSSSSLSAIAAAGAALLTAACSGNGHGAYPGDDLGTYQVVGHITDSGCGEGSLGATDPWNFEIHLSRAERELFWLNGREAIAGRVADDGVSFSFETRVEVEAAPAERGRKACVVSREDHASGELSAGGTEVLAFTSVLDFDYTVVGDSDCSGLIGVPGGFQTLPCGMSYELSGTRSAPPEDL